MSFEKEPKALTGPGKMPKLGADRGELVAGLYILSTPIGNARDISLRALDALKSCDVIAAEDTRVTAKLLAIYAISKPLISYNDHNAPSERPKILARLARGQRVVLLSDAGTPLISDPGYKLVRAAVESGFAIMALPGASAVLTGLTLAGLPSDRFFFVGFLPHKRNERRAALEELRSIRATLIFFESNQRLAQSLAEMTEIFGNRPAVVARELTKLHEEVRRGNLPLLAAHYEKSGPPKGEVTLLVGSGEEPRAPDLGKIDGALKIALQFMPLKAASEMIADLTEKSRKQIYARALELKNGIEHA